ncbi:hypothetical protein AVEN_98943-1 [Araneus ventricosus]|uniref:Uncharacterized protein n=1 Tax=Araneus ventricosus TaxID=182803 RepID=A0A4Y2F426_ARAVE|nr:hypothetical protein AVEN_98943-1 [Araneus ventricosus]
MTTTSNLEFQEHLNIDVQDPDKSRLTGKLCQACEFLGLLEDDEYWNKALEEADASRSPKILRNLFAIMLLTCSMSSPEQLWMNHKENLSEDILHQALIQQRSNQH